MPVKNLRKVCYEGRMPDLQSPLEYLERDEAMECAICHKKEDSKTRCVNGHYVCNDCHTAGMDGIIGLCLAEDSKDPIGIINKMMDLPFCHMHGPEHHVMVGAALLAAYKNAGGEIDLHPALLEMMRRGKSVPGGACGFGAHVGQVSARACSCPSFPNQRRCLLSRLVTPTA